MLYVCNFPLKTRSPRLGAYLVMFASPTTFRTTTLKNTSFWSETFKLGSLNRTQRSFQPIGWSSPFAKPLLDGITQFSIYPLPQPSFLLTSWYITGIPLIPLDLLNKYNCSLVDWTRWNLTLLGSIFMSAKHTHKLCWQTSSLQCKHGRQNQVLNYFGTDTKTKLHIIKKY